MGRHVSIIDPKNEKQSSKSISVTNAFISNTLLWKYWQSAPVINISINHRQKERYNNNNDILAVVNENEHNSRRD